ncbi:ABC transporter substrate-binding protein [Paenibacillus daejeonensis]|uniref:ABC transporter substrate-binding protein n=1 Tax=Paenibacillus daejeonensis TaxID=135193 RepID=UPI00037D4ABE|nr:extracellular solute-binding protein [Paenibacillus daejeonensis]
MAANTRKKITLFALYILTLVSVILYSFSDGTEQPVVADPEKVTLTFRHFWTKEHDRPILAIFEDAVRSFEQEHGNVKVNFEGIDQTIHREQKLKSEMVTGTPPDLFVLFGGAEFEPYARSQRLMELTDFVAEQGLVFRDLSLWTLEDRIYGLPFEGHAEPIFYNRALFDGLGLAPPSTLTELDAVMDTLLAEGILPFALGNEEQWPGAIYTHYLMDRLAGPQVILDLAEGKPEVAFANEPYLAALTKLQQWAQDGAFNSRPSGVSTEEAIELFTSGQAAMYLNGNWDITLLSAPGAVVQAADIGVLPFPTLEADQSHSMAGGYSIGIGLSAELSGPRKELALELMRRLYTKEVQQRIVYEGLRLPSMPIDFDPARTGPVFAQLHRLMESSPQTFIAYDNVLSPEVRRAFLALNDQLMSLEISPEEALQQLDAAAAAYWQLRNNTGGEPR